MQALGVIPTPFSTYVYYHGEKMQYYGKERLEHMFALRTFLGAGLRPTQASGQSIAARRGAAKRGYAEAREESASKRNNIVSA